MNDTTRAELVDRVEGAINGLLSLVAIHGMKSLNVPENRGLIRKESADIVTRLLADRAAGDDLDAMLDSVHPECGIRDLTVLPGIPASAVIIYPTEYDAKGRWTEYETYGGTGATRMEALANAVKSAKEATS